MHTDTTVYTIRNTLALFPDPDNSCSHCLVSVNAPRFLEDNECMFTAYSQLAEIGFL